MKRAREKISIDELKPGSRLIRANTRSTENEDGSYSIYLHDNLIAILYFNGAARLFSAGWKTNLTKQRLNLICQNINWSLFSWGDDWVLNYTKVHITVPTKFITFKDGILITPEGECFGAEAEA